jgi:ribosomal protein L4
MVFVAVHSKKRKGEGRHAERACVRWKRTERVRQHTKKGGPVGRRGKGAVGPVPLK